MHMPPQESHQHMQMQRPPSNNRMFRTMSVPHMAMGPGQHQPSYGNFDASGQMVLALLSPT